MIERISVRIATWIHNSNPEETESVDVLSYYIAVYISYIAIIGSSLTIGLFTGALLNTTITLVAFQLLRKVSGGFHLPSLTACVIVSTAVLSTAPHVHVSPTYGIVLGLVSIAILAIFAPSFKAGEINPDRFLSRKLLSIGLTVISLLIGESVLIKAFFLQAVTTIRTLRGGENKHE